MSVGLCPWIRKQTPWVMEIENIHQGFLKVCINYNAERTRFFP